MSTRMHKHHELNHAPIEKDSSAPASLARGTGAQTELPYTELQKLKADNPGARTNEASDVDNVSGISRLDGASRPEFRITVTLHVSNRLRRDPTGAFETICDVITATRRRLSERFEGRFMEGKPRGTRRGRRNHNAGKTVVPF